jgi:hypothetical protein
MDKLLINITDILNVRPASKEIDQSRIEPYIQEAQRHDLRNILGEALYFDFISKFDVTGDPMYANYQTLLNGGTWSYGGQSRQYFGLRDMLSYFALARFVKNNQMNVTRFGVVQKTNQNSEPISQASLNDLITELKSVAISYQSQVIEFLTNNTSTYTLYGFSKPVQTTGFRVFDL